MKSFYLETEHLGTGLETSSRILVPAYIICGSVGPLCGSVVSDPVLYGFKFQYFLLL